MTPEEADVAAARRLWLEIERCTDSDDERVLIAAALATTRRDAFAAGVEASAAHVKSLADEAYRIAQTSAMGSILLGCLTDTMCLLVNVSDSIRALLPEEPRDG